MPKSDHKVVQQLEAHKEELAELVTAMQFERHPKLDKDYGEEGRKKCYEDTIYHLDYLEQAVRVDSKKLFNNYLGWARTMLQERNIPKSDLFDNIVILREAITKTLPDTEASLLVEYVNDGLSSLQDIDTEEITFLHKDDPLFDEAREYLDLLLSGNRKEAAQLIKTLVDDGTSIKDIYEHIFQKTQYEVGALWQTNQITVAHEHYCTAATQLIMSQLYPQIFAMEKSDKRLVACSVANELHEIGIRMVTDFFEMEGWETHYLGANMPDTHLMQSIKENDPDVLAISVTLPLHISKAKNLIEKLRNDSELENLKIMVGGYPFKVVPDLWKRIGADASAGSASDAIETANKLIKN
ncbi:cobalamin B12-binding domain-containing protein [Fodinibius sp.]|uniref:cobalamin B12-binding domain-containing protein n=1 Tax=Fodinibius sp. TaxID=1872440 RepID=UPI002ACE7B92|nr:cobalamin-dependent protein [Fodinibius sp.]MDZ7659294.1 cobalamin-dependent protein [Fodinibius sp.]